MQKTTHRISKSRFIKGLQCHKALWLLTYRPELRGEVSQAQQTIFDAGTDVGLLAQQLYPGGVEVPFEGFSLSEQIERTRELISNGADVIYEAAFSYDNVFVKADVLRRSGNGWTLSEVKSATSLKDVYINDIALQSYVIANCGLDLIGVELVHINREYNREGDIDVDKLFSLVDVSSEVREIQNAVVIELNSQWSMLNGPEPTIDIGPQCCDPYECDFTGYCWAHIPEYSVFEFRDRGKPEPFELYRNGIIRMEDVPMNQLGWRQKMQVECLKNKTSVVNREALNEFYNTLIWPLAFLDFETTYMTAVPLFDGTRPYQPVPFQFSLHIQDEPNAVLRHMFFLAEDANDPRPSFLQSLVAAIPKEGSIVAWNKTFESGVIVKLSERFPESEALLLAINNRMVDLMAPFRSRDFYHWRMDGSYSIKAVLPALVPGLSYDDMGISSGDVAAASWLEMIQTDDQARRVSIRDSLLEYCGLDTLAMVRILEKLRAEI